MNQHTVAVLRGGHSATYDISMNTGSLVIQSLAKDKFKIKDIVINRKGEWLIDGYSRSPERALVGVDAVFVALMGKFAEDGSIQRHLDKLTIPYTGSPAFSSAVAFNKLLTKETLKDKGLKLAKHFKVSAGNNDLFKVSTSIGNLFGPSYVVKPVQGSSSIDTYVVEGETDLFRTLTQLLSNYESVLVEERIFGRDATVGVIDDFRGQETYSLPALELALSSEHKFLDYKAKYSSATSKLCPGRFTLEQKTELEYLAKMVHQTLGLKHYSRSDFIVADDGVYFLEVNTLPQLDQESAFVIALDSVGSSRSEFINHLVYSLL